MVNDALLRANLLYVNVPNIGNLDVCNTRYRMIHARRDTRRGIRVTGESGICLEFGAGGQKRITQWDEVPFVVLPAAG